MNTISELMTHDHRDCDGIFARAEELASDGDWADAAAALKKFADALNAHFDAEESTLFPAFEQATGMTQGPTMVMRHEHQNMRDTLAALQYALDKQDADDFAGEAETLLIDRIPAPESHPHRSGLHPGRRCSASAAPRRP